MAMGTSLIVACLAIAGLQAVRVQRRLNDGLMQSANAEKIGQAGIEFVQQRILTDSNWRTFFGDGVPVTRNTSGGSFTVTLSDPNDGVIANRSTDPVIVTSTGSFGSARHKLTAFLEPQSRLYPACRSALYARSSITFKDTTFSSNHWVYSENQIKSGSNPTVRANCMSPSLNSSDSSFTRLAIQGGTWPMEKPDLATSSNNYVGKYYIDNSVPINANDLPTGGTNLVSNSGFEINTSNWTGSGCTLTRDTLQRRLGSASCRVSGQGFLSSPIHRISEPMIKGRSYNISFWIRTTEEQNIAAVMVFTGSGSFIPVLKSGPTIDVQANVWTQVSASIVANWIGTLSKAEFMIDSEKNSDYFIDEASVIDAVREPGTRYIENVVLGDTNNPYGTNTVSTNGVYSIDVGGDKLLFQNCRINGTIVVKSANKVVFQNALSWEPTGRNFPAIIANADIQDQTSIASLSESTIGININSLASVNLSVVDGDTSDSYSTVINGPIVSTSDILLDGVTTLSGPVFAGQNIQVEANSLNVNFLSDIISNPPPGFFADPPPMKLITTSVQSAP